MNNPWFELEFDSVISISGVEFSIWNYKAFRNVYIRYGNQSTTLIANEECNTMDESKPIAAVYKEVRI